MMSEYLQRLRAKVGPDLLLLPSVTVLAFDAEGRVLLVRHADRNVWVAPGGMVEVDESPQQAAQREMLEETGCLVELQDIVGVYGGPEFRVRYQNGDEAGYVMTVFAARITAGQPQPDAVETLETGFFSLAETHTLKTGAWLATVLQDAHAQNRLR